MFCKVTLLNRTNPVTRVSDIIRYYYSRLRHALRNMFITVVTAMGCPASQIASCGSGWIFYPLVTRVTMTICKIWCQCILGVFPLLLNVLPFFLCEFNFQASKIKLTGSVGHRCWPYDFHSLLAQQHGVQSRYKWITLFQWRHCWHCSLTLLLS